MSGEVKFEPMECDHVWQLARSRQQVGYRSVWGPGRIFAWCQREVRTVSQYERIDEYYCSRCLKERVVRRRSEDHAAEWWSGAIPTESVRWSLWYTHPDGSFAE